MSDAQFAIDVTAQMDGTETITQLDALTQKLTGGGKNAQFFQDAISRVGKEIMSAGEATKAANAELATAEEEYSKLERAALQASKAFEKAGKQKSGVVDVAVKENLDKANGALAEQATKLRALEAAATGAASAEKKLAATKENLGTLNNHVNKSLAQQAKDMKALSYAFAQSGGPIGKVARAALGDEIAVTRLSAIMGAGSAQAVMFSIGLVAVSAALVVGAGAALGWGVSLANSARSAALTSEAMQAMHPELQALAGVIADTSKETGMHADELQGLAGKLREAKVAAADMPAALRAAALAEAALGKGGADEFVSQIKEGKKAVGALAADTTSKLGGIVAKQMMGLSAQSQRLSDNLAGTFGGLNIEPLLSGLSVIVGLFDKDTASGSALKFMFESLFQPIIDFAPVAATKAEALFLALEIGGLKAYLAVRPWIPWIESFGAVLGVAALAFGATFIPALVVGAGSAAVAFGGMALAVAAATWPFLAIGAAVVGVYEAFTHWAQIKDAASAALSSIASIGSDIIAGIVSGITGGAGAVISAIGGVVHGAIDSAKHALGIASPSKVFATIGGYTAEGFASGVDDGAPTAQGAMTDMVSPSAAVKQAQLSGDTGALAALGAAGSAPAATPAAAPASGGAGPFAGAELHFHANTADDAKGLADQVIEIVTRGLEGVQYQIGAPA